MFTSSAVYRTTEIPPINQSKKKKKEKLYASLTDAQSIIGIIRLEAFQMAEIMEFSALKGLPLNHSFEFQVNRWAALTIHRRLMILGELVGMRYSSSSSSDLLFDYQTIVMFL